MLLISFLFSLLACGQKIYKLKRDQYGQPILNDKTKYTFTKLPTVEDLKKIDTTACYIQTFEGRYYNEGEKRNPRILIFQNDGFVKIESNLYFGKFDKIRNKNTAYYGGRYRIIGSNIEIESFVSSPDAGDWYSSHIEQGKIEGDKIIFYEPGALSVFEKQQNCPVPVAGNIESP